ncbi:hypothetical protein RE628_11300 [Paenibacillus sp. D2_2]|uniref:hypothetical protein n=1 Tax=Paenibacillus sp. D2_2 TaxID=3073092 RepID=UPI0028166B82|nr:hypothetical protein [Paenibacillus sp. D2_2]WMT42813.1 hypothetical protein RE628_11300 [Paenibacillus sp. D2_2]
MAVSKEDRRRYQETAWKKEMTEIFESLEWSLFENFQRADSIMAKMSTEASACQIPGEFREQFMRDKLIDMFEQIAEQRGG